MRPCMIVFIGRCRGEHTYELLKIEGESYYKLTIGNLTSYYSTLTATQLVWEHRSLDGVDYIFARIE